MKNVRSNMFDALFGVKMGGDKMWSHVRVTPETNKTNSTRSITSAEHKNSKYRQISIIEADIYSGFFLFLFLLHMPCTTFHTWLPKENRLNLLSFNDFVLFNTIVRLKSEWKWDNWADAENTTAKLIKRSARKMYDVEITKIIERQEESRKENEKKKTWNLRKMMIAEKQRKT